MAHHTSPGEHVTVEATKQPVAIWSGEHRMWWRSNYSGYTRAPEAIGRYTMQEAIDATHHCGPEKQIFIRDLPETVGQSPTLADLQEIMRVNNELLAVLNAIPFPSTMGTAREHYERFYTWYHDVAQPAIKRAEGQS